MIGGARRGAACCVFVQLTSDECSQWQCCSHVACVHTHVEHVDCTETHDTSEQGQSRKSPAHCTEWSRLTPHLPLRESLSIAPAFLNMNGT